MTRRTPREARQVAFRDVPLPAILPLWLAGAFVTYFVISTYPRRHWLGADAHAYWLTAHHHDLYGIALGSRDAYNYSPAFAQLVHPIALLPWPAFLALWMCFEGAAFAWLLKPLGWRWAVPFWLCCTLEVGFGNIWGLLTVAFVLALRHPTAWAFTVLTKITPGVGMLWHVARREWRQLAVAFVATAAISAASYAVDPHAWREWIDYLTAHRGVAGGLPVRLAVAAVLVVVAARKRRLRWLLAPALLVSSPHLFGWQWITVLAGIPRVVDWRPAVAAESAATTPVSATAVAETC